MSMRIALGQIDRLRDDILRYAVQLGVTGIQVNTPALPGENEWAYADLLALRLQCEEYGLRLESVENVPIHFYDKVMLGLPGREAQIAHYQAIIRTIGRAGIPILGHHFMPNSVWRTSAMTAGRGGALVTSFDLALVTESAESTQQSYVVMRQEGRDKIVIDPDAVIATEAQMWENYAYFLAAVLPVAEEAGVKLALHPDDPPVPMLGGIARIFRNVEGFKRAYAIAGGSPAWGLNLCLGCCSEMPGGAANVREMIEFFGPKGRIFYVHFRDVKGTVPDFAECFIGEGNYNAAETMLLLKRSGFTGFLLDDHVPHMVDDTPWAHRGRAHAIGYMQGLMDAIAVLPYGD